MNEINFKNARFDTDIILLHGIADRMATPVGHAADLNVDAELAQLLRLRVAQICPCSYCLILLAQSAHDQGISAAKVAQLAGWRESTPYTQSEQAAPAYCEVLTRHKHVDVPAAHTILLAYYSEREIAKLAAIVINTKLWVRRKLAQGQVLVAQS